MNPLKIINKYYKSDSKAHYFLLEHSKSVTKKALQIAHHTNLKPDLNFIKEAAMLHDIGMFLTNAPQIGCFGDEPYICHTILGKELLEKEGFPKHALVCERHIGVGITAQDIKNKKLPLPEHDMTPISIEEKIISFADLFFSKNKKYLTKEKPISLIKKQLSVFGKDKLKIFDEWLELFKK